MDYEDEQEEQDEPQEEFMVNDTDAPFIDLQRDRKKQAYLILKDRVFGHTKTYDWELMERIGMESDFASIWHAIGWDNFVPIHEDGSHPITIQFLCSLREEDTGISFRLFGGNIISHGESLVPTLVLVHAANFSR